MLFLRVQHRFQSFVWRLAQTVHIISLLPNCLSSFFLVLLQLPIYPMLNECARYGFETSKERLGHYLEVLMMHAMNHPWIKWLTVCLTKNDDESKGEEIALVVLDIARTISSVSGRASETHSNGRHFSFSLQLARPTKLMARPIFFVSSNNTSDCSGAEDNPCDNIPRVFQSTPYRRTYKPSPLIQNKMQIEDTLSDISSSSSGTLEQSLDVNEIVRQVRDRIG